MGHVLIRRALLVVVLPFFAGCVADGERPRSPPEACDELADAVGEMFVRCGLGSRAEGLHLVIGDRATGTMGPEDGCNQAVGYDEARLDDCLERLDDACELDLAMQCAEVVSFGRPPAAATSGPGSASVGFRR